MLPLRKIAIVVPVVVCACVTAGCKAPATAQPTSSYGPTISASVPAVAGGAAVIVASDAPVLCVRLAESRSIREIPASINALTDSETAPSGSAGLLAAADDLTTLAAAEGAEHRTRLRDTAQSLEQLARQGISDQSAVADVVRNLTELGREVQDKCRFPLGASLAPAR